MTTITVPPTSLPVGDSVFGGSLDDVDNQIAITVDRTPAGGLNALTADSTVAFAIAVSYDSGATYDLQGSGGPWEGGTVLDKHGNPFLSMALLTSIEPGTGRLARLTVTVAGPSAVVVAGSIVTS